MKKFNYRLVLPAVMIISLQLVTCQQSKSIYEYIEPAHTEHLENSELSELKLTPRATERLGIQTVAVTEENVVDNAGAQLTQKVTPYASVIYDSHGQIWVYTNPEPLVFIRHEIKIDFIKGDKAYLLEGPPVGTMVVTQGAAELYGTEYHVGH
jgi:hypothetical protein